jgi:hemerythrin-like domain-containing protein
MLPTEILKEEHQAVLIVLDILDKLSQRIRTDLEINVEDLDQLLEILKEYVDRNHHGKEEEIFFPALEKLGLSRESGPVGVMLMEHDNGRQYIQGMRDAVAEFKAGNSEALKKFATNASYYTELMNEHIYKENNILYPMSDMHLSQEEKSLILEDFANIEKERIGTGKAGEYLRRISDLQKRL